MYETRTNCMKSKSNIPYFLTYMDISIVSVLPEVTTYMDISIDSVLPETTLQSMKVMFQKQP